MNKVLLGISGGIAAYKAAELARLLIRGGSKVQVLMTSAATEFITPLTLQTITGRAALLEQFAPLTGGKVRHIELADWAGVMVVAPASANTLGKMACGIADNLLTTIFMAVACPVVLVPSMNEKMYHSAAVQENLARLSARGCHVMDPEAGELACGVVGKGRMPEPRDILHFMRAALAVKDFAGVKALVTAGPTREPFDPVRFISNPSTGLMGYALARALAERGAQVALVSGPTHLDCPPGVELAPVTTTAQMYEAVLRCYPGCDLVIKAAAPSDYRPARVESGKIKKGEPEIAHKLVRNTDILEELGKNKGKRILVGFAAETDDVLKYARQKLIKKNLDLIVANDLTLDGAGFAASTNKVWLIDSSANAEELPLMEKDALAHCILDRVAALAGAKESR